MSTVFVLCASLLSVASARADSYTFEIVGNSNRGIFVAGNDYGDYVIRLNSLTSPCGSNASTCFQTYIAATKTTTYTTSQPTLAVAPNPIAGPGCTYSGSAFDMTCNNGHEIVFGVNGDRTLYSFNGQTLVPLALGGGIMFEVESPNGNLFLAEVNSENLYVGIDNDTIPSAVSPEPSSLALLGTGVLGVIGAARRRFAV